MDDFESADDLDVFGGGMRVFGVLPFCVGCGQVGYEVDGPGFGIIHAPLAYQLGPAWESRPSYGAEW